MDIGGQALIQQIVLGCGGQVLAAPDHVGDAHQVVVDDVGKVVGGHTVPFYEYLVVQGLVFHGDVPEDGVAEGGDSLLRDALADDIGLSGIHAGLGLLKGQRAAGIRCLFKVSSVLGTISLLTKTVIGLSLFHQQTGIPAIGVPPLRLNIGGHRTAHVGALVVVQAAFCQGLVNHIGSALHQAALVGVLNAQDEGAPGVAGDKPGVQRGAQVAHMHVARGGWRKPGAHLTFGYLGLHLLKILHVKCHAYSPPVHRFSLL